MFINSNNDLSLYVVKMIFQQLGFDKETLGTKLRKHPTLSNIIDVSKGGNHTFVKTSNNEIYAFGNNHFSN